MKNYLLSLIAISIVGLLPSLFVTQGQTKQPQTSAGDRKMTVGPAETVTSLPTRGKRYALIIGIDQYQDGNITPLKGAVNDAKALADALVKYAGFPDGQVSVLTTDQQAIAKQPTKANILKQLALLKGTVPADGMLLVAFAGHGMERNGQSFLLPADAQVGDISLLEETALAVPVMKERIKATGVDQVVLVLDACRNDPTSGRANADNPLTDKYARGFNFDVRNKEVKAFITLFATSPGQRAYEYQEKKQGYFTYELIEALKGKAANENGEVTLTNLVRYLQQQVPKQVKTAVGKEQKPYVLIDGYKADDLVISVTVNVGTNAASSPQPADSSAVDLAFWDTIKSSTNPEEFRTYIKEYPNGKFASLAKVKLSALEASTKPANPETNSTSTSNAEIIFWDTVKSSTNAEDYKAYLKKYPNGEFVELARNKLKSLEASVNPSGAASVPSPSTTTTSSLAAGAAMPLDPVLGRTGGEFVYIPVGEFQMGSTNGNDNENPVHRVRISRAFEMGKYEVTQAQWEAVMGNNPSYFKGFNLPVEKVSWEDVQQFISTLNSRSSKYSYRLPTEAEWEYACRAGTTGDYAGNLGAMGWYSSNSGKKTQAVGQKQPNGWGLYDMHGNVWEWCQDWYGSYTSEYQVDPQGPSSGSERVIRGGSGNETAQYCRSAYRFGVMPGIRDYSLGFRLVRNQK